MFESLLIHSTEIMSLPMVLLIGLMMGMLHATDADHLLTVSSLASNAKNSHEERRHILSTAALWALGHGSVLMILGFCLFLFNLALPESMGYIAELSVAAFLIYIGATIFYRLFFSKTLLKFEQTESHKSQAKFKHSGKSLLVGCLHGLAGSAAVLALLPLLHVSNAISAISYLLLFSLGVLLAMMICGGCFSGLMQWARSRGDRLVKIMLCGLGSAAVLCGGLVIVRTL